MNDDQKATAGTVGLGIAACGVCCAGPVIAAVGGLSTAGPIAGVVAMLGAGTAWLVRSRRSAPAAPDPVNDDDTQTDSVYVK